MFRLIRSRAAGFTLTEMAIVLAVVGVLAAGLWNLLSGANTQVRDESAASQQGDLMTAVKTFLASADGQSYMTNNTFCGGPCGFLSAGGILNFALPLPPPGTPAGNVGCPGSLAASMPGTESATWCSDLPTGYSSSTSNSYSQNYSIRVLRDNTANPAPGTTPPNTYSFIIMTTGGDTISDSSGARISSLIGGDGGFIYSAAAGVCGTPTTHYACGSYGGWFTDVGATYGFGYPATGGYIASRTYASPQQNLFNDWLARIHLPGDTTFFYNTMATPEYLGGQELDMGAYNALLEAGTAATPLGGGGWINMEEGTFNFGYVTNPGIAAPATGTMNVQGGTINMNAAAATVGGGTMNVQGGTIYLQGGQITNSLAGTADLSNISLSGTGATPVLQVTIPGGAAANPGINVATGCAKANQNDASCQWGLQIVGDGTATGLLNAHALYSETFVYGTPVPPSDIRLKTDIRPIQHALDDIEKLKPVSFKLKKTGMHSYGVIAQDIEKVYPDLVIDRGDGYKGVYYDGLIGPLISAIQELKQENDDLRKQIRSEGLRENELERKLDGDKPN